VSTKFIEVSIVFVDNGQIIVGVFRVMLRCPDIPLLSFRMSCMCSPLLSLHSSISDCNSEAAFDAIGWSVYFLVEWRFRIAYFKSMSLLPSLGALPVLRISS
jgi:hypothetical protein